MSERPTPDIVVIWLAAIVGFVISVAVLGAVALAVFRPGVDLTTFGARIADVTNTLIGALVGYLAGRGVITTTTKKPPTDEGESDV